MVITKLTGELHYNVDNIIFAYESTDVRCGDSDDDESGSSSEAGGDQNDDDDNQERPGEDGLSAEHVRQKKAAHARYMRFSRSLQSTSAAICMIDILTIGYHADDLSMLCVCVRACAYYQNRSFQTRQGINQTCANIACTVGFKHFNTWITGQRALGEKLYSYLVDPCIDVINEYMIN